ncbi:MAG: RluA family pseudouridine synthase [Desulfuromonadales bacterium]|nr:RluA family pseudouridine synthase [Desulfuromonadales bacterium]
MDFPTASNFRFIPGDDDSGRRLDQFVPSCTEALAGPLLSQVIEIGGVHVGGRRVRSGSQPVRAGEPVEIFLDGQPLTPWRLPPEAVLYRDRWLLAVNKPAGIETQPTPARFQGTLYEALLTFLHDPYRPLDRPQLGMAQRLDRDTSGVIVFSIHPRAHKGLTEALAGGQAGKFYRALVSGTPVPAEGEIRSQLARNRAHNRMKSVAKGGKEAITRYRTLEVFAEAALLEVQILTGRSHQIRAHLAEAGHPLLGDRRYGGPLSAAGAMVARQMLHAARIALPHPVSGELLTIEAPLAADLVATAERLRNGAG